MLAPTDGSGIDSGSLSIDASTGLATRGDLSFVGNEALAEEVVTSRVADAVGKPERTGTVFAGDTGSLAVDTIPDPDGSIAGAVADETKEGAQRRLPVGADDVSTERRGILLDPTELERRVNAVAAVARSFERAVASDADARPSGDAESS